MICREEIKNVSNNSQLQLHPSGASSPDMKCLPHEGIDTGQSGGNLNKHWAETELTGDIPDEDDVRLDNLVQSEEFSQEMKTRLGNIRPLDDGDPSRQGDKLRIVRNKNSTVNNVTGVLSESGELETAEDTDKSEDSDRSEFTERDVELKSNKQKVILPLISERKVMSETKLSTGYEEKHTTLPDIHGGMVDVTVVAANIAAVQVSGYNTNNVDAETTQLNAPGEDQIMGNIGYSQSSGLTNQRTGRQESTFKSKPLKIELQKRSCNGTLNYKKYNSETVTNGQKFIYLRELSFSRFIDFDLPMNELKQFFGKLKGDNSNITPLGLLDPILGNKQCRLSGRYQRNKQRKTNLRHRHLKCLDIDLNSAKKMYNLI